MPLVLVVIVTGCGEPSHEYLQKKEVGAYLKVPSDWHVVDEATLLDATPNLSPIARFEFEELGWVVAASPGSISAPAGGPVDSDTNFPLLQITVQPLNRTERGGVSLNQMRSYAFNIGSLPAGSYELFIDGDTPLDNGFRAIRRAVTLPNASGVPITFDAIVATDPDTLRLYKFSVSCTAQCYVDNADEIAEIFDSLHTEEP